MMAPVGLGRSPLRTALAVCRSRSNFIRTAAIAAVVGSVITLVNQGDVLVAGDATTGTAVKIGINFLIPFVSSNLGVLAYVRTAAAR
jgi:hypothetical protein